MASIHPRAEVSPLAHLGRNVTIGPFCVVEPGAVIGDDCILESRSVVKRGVQLGARNHLFEGAIIGGLPQHLKLDGEPGTLRIGDGNTIRESVTIHRALKPGEETVVGDSNLLMVGTHIAHDCVIGNHVIMANYAQIAGHVHVEDRAFVSSMVGVHQHCRVGKLAMIGALARVPKDVPPFAMIDGSSGYVVGLNVVGLRRAGFDASALRELKQAYRIIYRLGLGWGEVQSELAARFPKGPAAEFTRFFAGGARGFAPERRVPPGATLKIRRAEEQHLDSLPGSRVG